MAGVRAKDHEDKRQLILDQSAELFARQGFHRTSISEIAKACNSSSKAWIYHYFPNKEAVLFTLLRHLAYSKQQSRHEGLTRSLVDGSKRIQIYHGAASSWPAQLRQN